MSQAGFIKMAARHWEREYNKKFCEPVPVWAKLYNPQYRCRLIASSVKTNIKLASQVLTSGEQLVESAIPTEYGRWKDILDNYKEKLGDPPQWILSMDRSDAMRLLGLGLKLGLYFPEDVLLCEFSN